MRTIWLALAFVALAWSGAQAQALKKGDNLSITVLQDPKLDRNVVVDPQGQIAFPLAGHVRAAGLTPQALENVLRGKLRDSYKDEALDITVAVANSPPDTDD